MQILTCIRNVKPVMALLSHCWLGLLFHEINVYFEFKFELCPMNCQKTFARAQPDELFDSQKQDRWD